MKVIIHTVDGKEHVTKDDGTLKQLITSTDYEKCTHIISGAVDGKRFEIIFTKYITAIEFEEA